MPTAHQPRRHTRATSRASSASAQFGVIGLPEPGAYSHRLGDGGLFSPLFRQQVDAGCIHFIQAAPERRSHLLATPEFRALRPH